MPNKLDFPNKQELRTANTVEFKIFIPSTRNYTIPISTLAFNKRVDETAKMLSKLFGGSTIDIEQGSYLLKNKLVKEKVGVITVSATRKDYNKYDKVIEKFLIDKKKSWGQDSMGFVYQDKMIFI